MKHLIAITTHRRQPELIRLLDSLRVAISRRSNTVILVVDNDSERSARKTVQSHPLDIIYAVEPRPGIPAARNRCLDVFSSGPFKTLCFIDDDMWVDQNWFTELTSLAKKKNDPSIIGGAVVTVLPKCAPLWLSRGGYYQRKIHATGTILPSVGAGNVLITREAWELAGSPRFDEVFAATGGEDSDFFHAMRIRGIPIVASATAVAFEDVPPERMTRVWRKNRMIRNGVIDVKMRQKYGEPMWSLLVKGALVLLLRLVESPRFLLRGGGLGAPTHDAFYSQLGRLRALFGGTIEQYRSPKNS